MFSAKNCSNSFAFNSLWIVWRAKLHRHCKYLRPTSHHQVTDYVYAFNYTCIPSSPVYFYFIHFMSIYVNHTNNTTLQRCISRHLSKMMCDKYNLRYIYPPSPIPDVHIENSWPHNIIGNILFASTLFSYHVFMMFYKELVVFCVQYAEGTQLLGYTTW